MAETVTSSGDTPAENAATDTPPHRYSAALANEIEGRWQDRWEAEGTFHTPNPVGPLSDGFEATAAGKPPRYVLDMFPYPSGAGLHVGHPLGYIGTDVYARYLRMTGHNVVHAMGYDSFGLPAEQYALQTNTHPRVTTEANIANMRRQLRRLGLAHDDRRSVSTTDTDFYRWTQWIFLQIFGAWYDVETDRARPIDELVAALDAGEREPDPGTNDTGTAWAELDTSGRRAVVNRHRLAYLADVPVNWCPGLGTVLANEEVIDGRSERGNFPVYRRNLKQWMFRITAYADRLIDDLDLLDWTDAIKNQQRNWIGRSTGARVRFAVPAADTVLEVFTTRPDTIFGTTYMVVAPEHPLVDDLTAAEWPAGVPDAWTGAEATPGAAVAAYQKAASQRSEIDRQAADKGKTGVFTGTYATNPANDEAIPVFVADYVLMGYGTGAVMGVPGQDQRDWDFAETYGLDIVRTVSPSEGFDGKAYGGEGPAINSGFLDGMGIAEAKAATIAWLVEHGHGTATVQYKLRDWLFSRQRYWGEPFPIVFGADGEARALPEDQLPLELPPMEDFTPTTSDDEDSDPEPPLGRVDEWTTVELDLGDGVETFRRELNTMPNWAGSCWYELRYLDPTNDERFVDPENERYWMGPEERKPAGGVDLYVGGAEHAVLHLLYARFWHKVLYDLGHVSSQEPFHRLFNQGMIQAPVFRDDRGFPVPAAEVVSDGGAHTHEGRPVTREIGKIGKSLKNVVTPDEIFEQYGTDTLRLYEMFTGPLDQSRPWDSTAIVGMFRLLQRIWRVVIDEETGAVRVASDGASPSDETQRVLHQTIASVREGMEGLRSNTSIARITELTNHLTSSFPDGGVPRSVAEDLVLLLAPLAPHTAEELWSRLGHDETVTYAPYPEADPAWLVADTVELPVQVNGKVRGRITVPTDAGQDVVEAAARDAVADHLDGATVRKVIVVPGRMVSFVIA